MARSRQRNVEKPRLFVQALAGREAMAGLPAGRLLEDWLGADGGQAVYLPVTGVPVLTYLQHDLAAGFCGSG